MASVPLCLFHENIPKNRGISATSSRFTFSNENHIIDHQIQPGKLQGRGFSIEIEVQSLLLESFFFPHLAIDKKMVYHAENFPGEGSNGLRLTFPAQQSEIYLFESRFICL